MGVEVLCTVRAIVRAALLGPALDLNFGKASPARLCPSLPRALSPPLATLQLLAVPLRRPGPGPLQSQRTGRLLNNNSTIAGGEGGFAGRQR